MSAVQPDVRCRYCGLVMSAPFLQRHASSCDLVPSACPRGCGALLQTRYLKLHLKAECTLRHRASLASSTTTDGGPWPPPPPPLESALGQAWAAVAPRPDAKHSVGAASAESAAAEAAANAAADVAREAAEAAAAAREAVDRERGTRMAQTAELAAEIGRLGAGLSRLRIEMEERHSLAQAAAEENQRQARRALGEAVTARAAVADEREARAASLAATAAAAAAEAAAATARVDAFAERLETENALIAGVWSDAAERAEAAAARAERRFEELERDLRGARARLRDLEEAALRRDEARPPGPHQPGRLLWKVDEIMERIKEAQSEDEPLHSPIFYSGHLGYKLRVELWLNGLGQWRDRHIIASLRQLPCEWSSLLPKQAVFEATLTLRDQPDNPRQAKHLVKTLSMGRAKGEPKDWHVFIPHTALQQQNYVRDGAIFLDVSVNSQCSIDIPSDGEMVSVV